MAADRLYPNVPLILGHQGEERRGNLKIVPRTEIGLWYQKNASAAPERPAERGVSLALAKLAKSEPT